jgi:hypothetical protein
MKKMRSFLLLELIIGLLLLTLCLLPFIRIPSAAMREELLIIQRLEMQHMADRVVAWVKERIYTQQISWEQIAHTKQKPYVFGEDTVFLPVKELAKQRYMQKCVLYSTLKKGQNNEEYRLVTVTVQFTRIPRALTFFSQKKKSMRFSYQILVKQEKAKPQVDIAT